MFVGCGTVAGALRSYYPLFDVRVVYQYYCNNLPRPGERQYDLFFGLDPQGSMTVQEVRNRVNECTGNALPAAQRSAQQRQNLTNITSVVRIPEGGLLTNLVVTLLAIDDSRAYVENETAYRETFQRAGTQGMLYQAYTNQGGHCQFTQPESLAVFEALKKWIETRTTPTYQDLTTSCERYRTELGGACRFNPSYQPARLETRMYARQP
ncbi:MAG: hypothetical protein ACREMQ_05790 [Longimicrobiales bacterium]